jgi:hypothetical protein
MNEITGDEIPEFLRDPGIPGSSPPKQRGPGSSQPPGKVFDGTANLSQTPSNRQVADDGRKLVTLEDLDILLPQLQLREYRPRVSWQREAPSGKQLEYLKGIGISPEGFNSRGLASKVLDYFRGRRERGLASLRQLIALIGAEVQGAEHIGFEEAKRLLSERFRNRGGA